MIMWGRGWRGPGYELYNHEAEVRYSNIKVLLADEAAVKVLFSARVVPAEDIFLVRLVVIGVYPVKCTDLVRLETRGCVLTWAAR